MIKLASKIDFTSKSLVLIVLLVLVISVLLTLLVSNFVSNSSPAKQSKSEGVVTVIVGEKESESQGVVTVIVGGKNG